MGEEESFDNLFEASKYQYNHHPKKDNCENQSHKRYSLINYVAEQGIARAQCWDCHKTFYVPMSFEQWEKKRTYPG